MICLWCKTEIEGLVAVVETITVGPVYMHPTCESEFQQVVEAVQAALKFEHTRQQQIKNRLMAGSN